MAIPFSRLRKRACLTWQQRLAGVALAIFVLMHTPTFSFLVEFEDDSVRTLHWSPLQTVAVGLLKTNPELINVSKVILLPGAFFESVLQTVDACYVDRGPCDWTQLFKIDVLLNKASMEHKVSIFTDKMGGLRQLVQAAAAAATVFSFTSVLLDGTIGLIVGYGGLAYVTSKAGCEVIAATNLCVATIIAIYIMMGEKGADSPLQTPEATPQKAASVSKNEKATAARSASKKRR